MDDTTALLHLSDLERGPSLDEVLADAARGACEALQADAAAIALIEGETVSIRGHYGFPDGTFANWRVRKESALKGVRFRNGEPHVSTDIVRDADYTDSLASKLGVHGVIMLPLQVNGDEIGCLYIGSFTRRRFTEDDLRVASVFGRQIASSVVNAHLLEIERRERQRFQTLLELVRAAGSSLSLNQVLIQICDAAARLSVADRCSILLLDETSQTLEPFMSLGLRNEKLWRRFRDTARIPLKFVPGMREAFLTQKPIIIGHADRTRLIPQSVVRNFGMKTAAIYPMTVRDQVVGIMVVDSVNDYLRFPGDEIETMTAIARQAAVVIDNARLLEQEQKQRQRAEALLQVVSAANLSLSVKDVLMNLCRSVLYLSAGERCSVFLFDPDSGTLEPIMSLGPDEPVLWERFQAAAGLRIPEVRGFGTAADVQEPVIESHAPGSGIVPEFWIEAFGIKSLALYPLVVKETTVGVMAVDSSTDFVDFPPDEVDTLAAIARQAAVIIENARLHEKVQQQAIADPLTGLYNHRHLRERLEQEIARARRPRRSVAVLMMDIDNLKLINDSYGHQTGDEALKFLATVLQESCRAEDIVGRYGGDEFTIVLPEADLTEARRVAERIQTRLATRRFENKGNGVRMPVRLSMGLACYPGDATTMHHLVDVADRALYRSKQRGGGCITTAHGRVEELMPADGTAFSAMQGLVAALIQKEPFTREHVGDVARYAVLIADALGLGEKQKKILRRAGWVHDVGKIAVPDRVVLKPGPLDENECRLVRQHVEFSETILHGIDHLADVVPTVAAHHEWFDGSGYPRGLKGRRIPITGRILAVADAYLAMISDRPYRRAMSRPEAIEQLQRGAGTQFDPKVVEALIRVLGSGAVDSRAA